MKTLRKYANGFFAAFAMMAMVAFNSCTDEEETVITPEFPELKEVKYQVGEMPEITFSANLDWTLTSNAAWCKIVDGEFRPVSVSGKAGNQTLQIEISDESWNYNSDDVAELTLKMGEQSQVIYKVTRGKKEYQDLVVTDGDGKTYTAEVPFVVKGNTNNVVYTSLTATADEGLTIGVHAPDWLVTTYNENKGCYDFTFNTESKLDICEEYSNEGEVITFQAANSAKEVVKEVSIPVKYAGFDKRTVVITRDFDDINLSVTNAGKPVVDGVEKENLTFEITAFNYDYEVVCASQTKEDGSDQYTYTFENLTWVKCNKVNEGKELTISFESNTDSKERSAIALVLPREMADEAKSNYKNYLLDETGELKSEFNRFILVAATQQATVVAEEEISFVCRYYDAGGLLPTDSNFGMRFESVKISESEELNRIKEEYSLTISNIWKIELPSEANGMMPESPFVFEAVGMGTDQTMKNLSTDPSVTAEYKTYENVWSQADMSTITVKGIVISSAINDHYDIAVMNADGTTIASFCRIQIVTQ